MWKRKCSIQAIAYQHPRMGRDSNSTLAAASMMFMASAEPVHSPRRIFRFRICGIPVMSHLAKERADERTQPSRIFYSDLTGGFSDLTTYESIAHNLMHYSGY